MRLGPSRRPGARFNRGRIATNVVSGGAPPVTATDPLTIVASKTNVFYLVGDLGITIGTGVSAWANQGPAGATGDASQGTGAQQPARNVAGLNGRDTLRFDGIDDSLVFASLDLPAPGTTPTWFFTVFRQITWTANDSLYGTNAATALRLFSSAVTPELRANNTTSGPVNTGAVLASWVRAENLFSNSVADYLKLATTGVTGTNTGNSDAGAGVFRVGAHVAGAGCMDCEIACFAAWAGEPTAGEKTALSTWVTAYYGGSVGV